MKSLRATNITTAKAVIIKPPHHVILGKKHRRRVGGNLRDTAIFCDFLTSFCYVAMERCSPSTADWPKMKFGQDYEHSKCPDARFQRHVEENCQLAEQYIAAGRLLAFEVCMVTPSETQLVGFRVTISRLRRPDGRRSPNIYARLSAILEKVRTMEITEKLDTMMSSCKYRPRIRLLARLRPQSKRKADKSKVADKSQTFSLPISNSIRLMYTGISFYAFM
ncbi:Cystatin domain-containing protein [Caenorhabditis elegans]|uniref:Cystatin domain-containing protein n=1 Tax=Caenorhabditis elegans TaxID=6239 RepID=Q7YTM2_CAEEL|nr:Cystatin domain-containing protein [Caenorhabditis elegans]CAE17839.1 Cystatin domain-containing protein [Caenorhabditis elegans]|eukprot:NP_001021520.1 Uncharacterized protein CELE_F58D5.9 [Caenorhabditis elegans]